MLWIILLIVVILIAVWGIATYNSMVRQREMIPNAMAQIAAQTESRWDALTNLIAAAKQYADFEAGTLEQIVAQRSSLGRDSSVRAIEQDDNLFESALSRLNLVVEQYPTLRTSELYQTAMNSVNSYENQVRQARMMYNDSVTRFNRMIKTFPNSFIASLAGFSEEAYFEGTSSKAEVPTWN